MRSPLRSPSITFRSPCFHPPLYPYADRRLGFGPNRACQRMRSYRQLQRRQWRSIRIEIAAVEIDALVKRRYLDPSNRDDLSAIGEAATAFISDALFGM